MSKKHKHRGTPSQTIADVHARADRAASEGRFQLALELAKQIYAQEPTPAHREYLLHTYLGRARELLGKNHNRDAATVLRVALGLAGNDPTWKQRIAEQLAAAGEAQLAIEALPADSAQLAALLGKSVDAALAEEAAGRARLPPNLHADFDRILKAFAQLEAKQDDAVRETLQPIGLRSPFADWRLLLRGLQAYYQGEDPRALENWSRLDPERFPARLAAPFRAQIDPDFQKSQPPQTQAALRSIGERLEGNTLVLGLQALQAAMTNPRTLAPVFRQTENLLPTLRQQAPNLVPRLASVFYWALIKYGTPEDVPRYQRLFGVPPQDPNFDRLRALGYEEHESVNSAHSHWARFEQMVAASPAAWPGAQARLVRALVWQHMGENAASFPDLEQAERDSPQLVQMLGPPPNFNPPAERCFQRSIELAPEQRGPYAELFGLWKRRGKPKEAAKVARQLLERLPGDVEMLEGLADLRLAEADYPEAISLYQRALKANPLDRELRERLRLAHVYSAGQHAEAKRFDEARREFQTALSLSEGRADSTVYCKWAACEFKAGDRVRAEELLREAQAKQGGDLAIAYSMLIETIRMKLPRTLKTRFDREFKRLLAEPPTVDAVSLAVITWELAKANVTYVGQKSHQSKVRAYLQKAWKVPFTERQREEICQHIDSETDPKLLRSFAEFGIAQFTSNPWFRYWTADAMLNAPGHPQRWAIEEHLNQASRLAAALPPDAKRESLLQLIEVRRTRLRLLSPFGLSFGMLGNLFGGGGGEDDYEDDDGF